MGGGGTQVLISIQTKRYTQAMGSKDKRTEETFRLDGNDPICMPESHLGNKTPGRQKGDRGKLHSLTKRAENV